MAAETPNAHKSEDEMLPDERAAIDAREESLDDEESHLSLEEVADNLGLDL